jgi:hypothetical protein
LTLAPVKLVLPFTANCTLYNAPEVTEKGLTTDPNWTSLLFPVPALVIVISNEYVPAYGDDEVTPSLPAAESDNVFSYAGDVTKGIYAWGAQVELGSFASSYIATTTIAVARNADVLTYSSAGNIDGTKGWCYAEISANWDTPPPSNYCAIGFGTSIEGLITGSVAGLPTEIRAFDGTNSVQQAGNPTMYRTPRNTAVTWGGSSMSVGQSGVVTAGSFDGNIGTTAIGVGNSGAGAFQWFGTIRNVRLGQRGLSTSEEGAITA